MLPSDAALAQEAGAARGGSGPGPAAHGSKARAAYGMYLAKDLGRFISRLLLLYGVVGLAGCKTTSCTGRVYAG